MSGARLRRAGFVAFTDFSRPSGCALTDPLAKYGVHSDVTLEDYAGYLAYGTVLMLFVLTYHGLYEKQTLLRYLATFSCSCSSPGSFSGL